MRCFACNNLLASDHACDIATGRYYCDECFSYTIDVQLAKMSSDAKKEGFDFDDGSDIDPGEFINEVSLEELEGAIEDPDPFNDEEQLWS